MTLLLATLLTWSPEAAAWPLEPMPEARLPDVVSAVLVLPRGEGQALVALSFNMGWILDPTTGAVKRLLPAGGRDAEVLDLDGDGKAELVVCGDDGLSAVRWDGAWRVVPVKLDAAPCAAIARLEGPDGPLLATSGAEVRLWAPDGAGGLSLRETADVAVNGAPLLAVQRGYLAVGAIGSSEIYERGPVGDSVLAAGGPVGGLALGPRGWAWSLPERDVVADLSHRVVAAAPGPTALVDADLDGDGVRDLVVLHPEAGLLGVIPGVGAAEHLTRLKKDPTAIAAGDLDGDGCADVAVAWRDAVRVFRSTACAGAAPAVADAPERSSDDAVPVVHPAAIARDPLPLPPRVFGLDLPPFLGDGAIDDVERLRPQQYVVLGTGWVIGGTLRNTWLEIPFFPALTVELEGGGPRARWFVGGDSGGLFFWLSERPDGSAGGGIHLANLTAGATFGSPRLRAGPFATAGLYNAGAGLRTVFTPWQESALEFRGIEARLTWFAPSTGQVALYYVWSEPLRRPTDAQRASLRSVGRSRVPEGPLACRRFSAATGLALGASSTRASWEFVGSDVPVAFSPSPALALSCDTGKAVGLLLGAETAPLHWFITTKDDKLFHMGTHTLGVMFGSDRLRVGPIASGGIWLAGAGLRTSVVLREDKQGLAHLIDVRALALAPSAPSGQLMVLYGIGYDPRR